MGMLGYIKKREYTIHKTLGDFGKAYGSVVRLITRCEHETYKFVAGS